MPWGKGMISMHKEGVMASFLGVQAKGLFTNATANKLDHYADRLHTKVQYVLYL